MSPSPLRKTDGPGRWSRREVRDMLVQATAVAVPQLEDWIAGRVKLLIGFKNAEEAAKEYHRLLSDARANRDDADKRDSWADVPEDEKALMIGAFTRLVQGDKPLRSIAMELGPKGQQSALALAMQYGLGAQVADVDEEGNARRGVVVMPPLDIDMARIRATARIAREDETIIEQDQLEYVEEDILAVAVESIDLAPDKFVDRVRPEVVAIIRARREVQGFGKRGANNGHHNGNGNGDHGIEE